MKKAIASSVMFIFGVLMTSSLSMAASSGPLHDAEKSLKEAKAMVELKLKETGSEAPVHLKTAIAKINEALESVDNSIKWFEQHDKKKK